MHYLENSFKSLRVFKPKPPKTETVGEQNRDIWYISKFGRLKPHC